MRPMDKAVCEITCPACRRAAAIVSPNGDGTYTIEDYRRGVDPWKTDPAKWRKQTTQWRWRPDPAPDAATIAYGACILVGERHAARGFTCTKSGCQTTGHVLQNDLITALATTPQGRVTRLHFKSM